MIPQFWKEACKEVLRQFIGIRTILRLYKLRVLSQSTALARLDDSAKAKIKAVLTKSYYALEQRLFDPDQLGLIAYFPEPAQVRARNTAAISMACADLKSGSPLVI